MTSVFFDLETTGFNAEENAIFQLGYIIDINGKVKEKGSLNMKPYEEAIWDKEVVAFLKEERGLIKKTINQYPSQSSQFKKFVGILAKHIDRYNPKDKAFLIGYNNNKFDNQFLRNWFIYNGDNYFGSFFWSNALDVLVLAGEKLKEVRGNMPNFKLGTVAKQLGISFDPAKAHDALYDIEKTRKIYYLITKQ